jgi:hypothetical protein
MPDIKSAIDRVSAEIVRNTPPSSPNGRFLYASDEIKKMLNIRPEHMAKLKADKPCPD